MAIICYHENVTDPLARAVCNVCLTYWYNHYVNTPDKCDSNWAVCWRVNPGENSSTAHGPWFKSPAAYTGAHIGEVHAVQVIRIATEIVWFLAMTHRYVLCPRPVEGGFSNRSNTENPPSVSFPPDPDHRAQKMSCVFLIRGPVETNS